MGADMGTEMGTDTGPTWDRHGRALTMSTKRRMYQLASQRRGLYAFQQGGFKGASFESAMLSMFAELPHGEEHIEESERHHNCKMASYKLAALKLFEHVEPHA